MSADNALLSARVYQFRLYVFAFLVYMGIASLLAVPAIQKAQTQAEVKNSLARYLNESRGQPSGAVLAAAGAPASIEIKRLSIKLPAAPGYYNVATRKWTLDNSHVFVDNSTNPNATISTHQQNITFIYGHDIPGVLIKTSQLTYGDIMTINTQNGYQFRYYYDKSRVISPTDISVLSEKNTGDSVVLATCTGTWYQFRHAMYFKLLSVRKLPDGPFMKVKQ